MQMAINDDANPFGDRYLVRDNALTLDTEVGSYIETATDVMLVDYRGGNMVWQGLNLFVDSANPAQPGNVAVIYERNEDDQQNGLRVHCNRWSSDMAPIEVKDFNWYRLKTRVERTGETQGKVYAKIWNTETREPSDWMIVTDLPTTAALSRTAMACATSAQYGYERNPRVAFGEVSVNNNQPVDTTSLQVADRDVIVADHFEDLIVYMDKFPQSRGGFDNREMVYDEIIEQTDRLAANYPEYTDLLKVKRAKMRVLGAKNRWDEFDIIANDLERSPVLRERLADRSAVKERQVSEKYNYISRKFKERKFEEIKPEIEQFMADHPNDPRTPEMHRVLCHVLHQIDANNDYYWQVSNDFIDRAVLPQRINEIIFDQAVKLLKEKRPAEAREKINVLLENNPQDGMFDIAMMGRAESLENANLIDELGIECLTIVEEYGIDSYAGASYAYYYGQALAKEEQYTESIFWLDQIIESEALYTMNYLGRENIVIAAAHWRTWVAKKMDDQESIDRIAHRIKVLPRTVERDKYLSYAYGLVSDSVLEMWWPNNNLKDRKESK